MDSKDDLVKLRRVLQRRYQNIGRTILRLSSRIAKVPVQEDIDEMKHKRGEQEGLGFALKCVDKPCQTEMAIYG